MSSARDEVLARVRAALGSERGARPVPRDYRAAGTRPATDLLPVLIDRLEDYRAAVRVCAADETTETIRELLADRGAARVIAPDGFPAAWLPDGVSTSSDPSIEELDACDGVVTTCAVAIAATGTIVLDHGYGQGPRRLTLVPDHHLIVVRSDQIVPDVPDAVARLDPTRPLTWISGPSATSDIELDRVEGVHGPRNLQVLIAQ